MSTVASRQYNFVTDKGAGVPITASRHDAEFDNIITKLNQKVLISAAAPASPIAGQLWLDSTNKLLKQYRNAEWVIMGAVHVGATAPATLQEGDLWYDTTNNLLESYNGAAWGKHLSFPTTTGGNMLWMSAADTIATIPSAATSNVLRSQGVGSCPAWGKVNLNTDITGTLPQSAGGTGNSKFERGYNVSVPATTDTLVVFASNFGDTLYSVILTGNAATYAYVKAKSVNSFVAYSNANNTCDWVAVGSG